MLLEFTPTGCLVHGADGATGEPQSEGYWEHGYTVRGGVAIAARRSEVAPEGLRLEYAPEGGVHSQVAWRGAEMAILTDHAGGFPIYEARTASSVFLSDDAWRVVEAAGLSGFDHGAVMNLLAYEFVFGARTLIEGLGELEAGCLIRYSWTDGVLTEGKSRVWRYDRRDKVWAGGWEQRVAECTEMLRDICRPLARTSADGGGTVALNLSGGWDSRAILAILAAEGCPSVRTCTYGERDFDGTEAALECARIARADARFAPFDGGDHLRDDFDALCAEMPPTVRFNLGDGAYKVSTSFYDQIGAAACGHCGGATRALTLEPIPTARALADWLIRTRQSGLRPERLRQALQPAWRHLAEAPNENTMEMCAGSFIPDVWGTQRYWLEQMVRRDVCSEMRILDRRAPMVFTPFLERRFWDFWASVPAEDLDRQKLYRASLARDIFAGPMAAMGRIPREGGGLIDYDATMAGRMGARVRWLSRAALRRVSPATAYRLMTADPTAAWWRDNAGLRRWVGETVMGSEVLNTLFEPAALRDLCTVEPGRNFRMANIGVWLLLTVAGVERKMAAVNLTTKGTKERQQKAQKH